MLKIFLFVLVVCGSTKAQSTRALCPLEILATKRISVQKCEKYWSIMKEPVRYGPKGPCGWANVTSCGQIGFKGMIVGGIEAAPMEFPHMAALGWKKDDGSIGYHCGGSLISDRFVLTVAHCLKYDGKEPDVVLLGDLDLSTETDTALPLKVPIKQVIKHERYDTRKNDIAVIELAETVTFNKNFIRPACLQFDEFRGTKVAATGWGLLGTYEKRTSDKLMKVGLPINKMSRCRFQFEDEDLSDESQICAGGEKGRDTCKGDSGGPIQLPVGKDAKCIYRIIGLTSYGTYRCASGSPAIYTKVSHFIDWIESKVWPDEYKQWKEKN